MILISGGSVLTRKGFSRCDVVVKDGNVTLVDSAPARSDVVIDATGCLVGPAFVDLHTHMREPGQTWKEDIESASRAAAAGGYGAVVAMPNTDPPIDTPKVVETVMSRGAEVGLVDVTVAAALTEGRSGAVSSDIEGLYRSGVRMFSDDGDSVTDGSLMRQLMNTIATLPGAVVAQHAEDPAISAGGHMHEGETSRRLGVAGSPASAETSVVTRDLDLAGETGARYHCQHVSSMETVRALEAARARGVRVSAEVTPHHLTFDDSELETGDTNFKMYPPLRSSQDRVALVEALKHGIIDVVATDHAPHTAEEKNVAFEEAPRGVIGLETAAAAVWEVLKDPDRFFEVMSIRPAVIAGLSRHGQPLADSSPANIVVFDPSHRWTVTGFISRSSNSPYLGREMLGSVRATIHEGEVVYRDGEVS